MRMKTAFLALIVLLASAAAVEAKSFTLKKVRGTLKASEDCPDAKGRFMLGIVFSGDDTRERLVVVAKKLDADTEYEVLLGDSLEKAVSFGELKVRKRGFGWLKVRKDDFPEDVDSLVDFSGANLYVVADEETGNKLGIEYLLDNHDIFKPDDIIVVPDGGEPDGSAIEVAEKGIVWVKCMVKGKSTHGSTPERGVNAHLAAAHLIVKLDEILPRRFDKRNDVFDPPESTFAVTKIEPGVPNVNTIPGDHTFYLDCRVMPDYDLSQVIEAVKGSASEVDQARGTTTEVTTVQRMDAAPPTPNDAPVVGALQRAIKAVYGIEARPMGIGGGTVAACIRRKGFSAAVWARMDETMHGPNEYCIIDNLIGDAKVFAHLLLG